MKEDFGRKVRYYRQRAEKTQKELADYLGYKTSSSVAKIEDGTNDVPLSAAEQIATFLGISMRDFFEPIPQDNLEKYSAYVEYLPYLALASEETIRNIRFMLGMPVEVKKSNDGSSIEAECLRG